MSIFHSLIIQPLYNILVAAYDVIPPHDFGIAIIVTTIIIKLLLLRLSHVQIKNQRIMQELQPQLKDIRERYKDDKQRQAQEMMALYKKHNTTPVSGCLPLIVQIVVFIAFYRILLTMTGSEIPVNSADLYSFVPNPGTITATFFGIDLSVPSYGLAVLAAIAQYYQMKMIMAKLPPSSPKPDSDAPDVHDFAESMSRQMVYIAPVMTLFIGLTFPGGLALYWLTSTLFMIAQQLVIMKSRNA